jgi:toxin ParE1/3/4
VKKPGKVTYGVQALTDIKQIFDYASLDSPSRAADLVERIVKEVSHLSQFPRLGLIPKSARLQAKGYRVLVVDDFLIFYGLRGRAVRIRRVLHGARRYAALL